MCESGSDVKPRPPAGKIDGRYNCFESLKYLRIYLSSPVRRSAAHNFICLYGPAKDVQNEVTI